MLEPQLEQHHLSVQLPPQEVWAVDLDTHTLVHLILRCCNLRPILRGQTWNGSEETMFGSTPIGVCQVRLPIPLIDVVLYSKSMAQLSIEPPNTALPAICAWLLLIVYTDVENCSNFMSNGLIPMQNFKTGSCRIRKKGIAIITRKKFCKTHQLERSTLPDLPYQENSKKWDQKLSHTLLLHTLLHCYCP